MYYSIISISIFMVYKVDGYSIICNHKIVKNQPDQIKDESTSNSPTITNPDQNIKNKPISIPLYTYLSNDHQHYQKFAQFLTTCFALENLLFFVRVIAFRHVLLLFFSQTQFLSFIFFALIRPSTNFTI